MATRLPNDLHEWVSFDDEDEARTWVFDITFLASSWTCIFGNGCQGVLTGPAPELVQGCCSYGAHFVDDEDIAKVTAAAATLTKKEWQFKSHGKDGIATTTDDGETITKLVDDACIFLNRPGFGAGPGCALHQVAVTRGISYIDLKPEVCWQLPLRRDEAVSDDGHVTTTISEWQRKHWGAGGEDFHWWCTQDPAAFGGDDSVYVTMEDELIAMVGKRVYNRLGAYFTQAKATTSVPLPHPTVRPKSAKK